MAEGNELRISRDAINAALAWSARMHAILSDIESKLGEPGYSIFRVTGEIAHIQKMLEQEAQEAHKMQARFGFSIEEIRILEIIRSNVYYRVKQFLAELFGQQKSKDYYRLLDQLDNSKNDLNRIRQILLNHGVDIGSPTLPTATDTNPPAEQLRSEGRSFAEIVRNRRKAANLTQAKLAERAGLKQGHISELESSLYDPRLSSIVALADALGVEPGDLIPKGRGRG